MGIFVLIMALIGMVVGLVVLIGMWKIEALVKSPGVFSTNGQTPFFA